MTGVLTGWDKEVTHAYQLLEIDFPLGTARFITGPAPETFGGNTYYGLHPDWGSVVAISNTTRDAGVLSGGWSFSLKNVPQITASARDPETRGVAVRLYNTEVTPEGGITWVEAARFGNINKCTISHGLPGSVEFEVSSAVDFVSDPRVMLNLSPEGQKKMDPSDTFCAYMHNVDRTLPWGANNIAVPVLTAPAPSFGGAFSSGYKSGGFSGSEASL